ncbi:MAG: TRAP transporter small permease subunit, partial [Rubrivivax sp.]|nr:TRAP transporter small permease subunit [Rubrivivax sp.]
MSGLLQRLAVVFALAGAAVTLAVAAMVVASIVGRAGAGAPIPGDVELTQFGVALAVSLGLPWCQWQRANIIVEFFTQKLPPRA